VTIALVTGATAGFGGIITRRFAKSGYRVVALGRRKDRLRELEDELGTDRVHTVSVDLRDSLGVDRALKRLPIGFREVGVLVNNAGLALGLDPAQNAAPSDWDTMVDTNIKGVLNVTRAILPGMVERDKGSIIMIGSTAASWPYPGGNVYGATKAFVKQFSLGLRADLLGTRVRVSVIEPGLVGGTEFSLVRFSGNKDLADKPYANTVPLTPDDIAEAVSWICSLPEHVNINTLEMMPVSQSFGPLLVSRSSKDVI
jgi:3-hydroxy acid dehydrogenase/malonic semialdehyde reductase